jgi:hypothetical protein
VETQAHALEVLEEDTLLHCLPHWGTDPENKKTRKTLYDMATYFMEI